MRQTTISCDRCGTTDEDTKIEPLKCGYNENFKSDLCATCIVALKAWISSPPVKCKKKCQKRLGYHGGCGGDLIIQARKGAYCTRCKVWAKMT